MSTLTATYTPAPTSRPARTGVTFPRVVTSEWIKFRSLRSTPWTLGSTLVAAAGIAFLAAVAVRSFAEGVEDAGFGDDPSMLITSGTFFAQLPLVVLGVLMVTGEYSTGMIRSTFAATPRRLPALWAKALVVGVAAAVVGLLAVGLSYLVTLPFHSDLGITQGLADPEALRITLGSVLYLATITLLALAIGTLVRHSAGALAIVLGLLLVIEQVFAVIPHAFFQNISPFLPATAGGRLMLDEGTLQMIEQMTTGPYLDPWQGYAVLAAWVVVLLTAAAVLVRRRDA